MKNLPVTSEMLEFVSRLEHVGCLLRDTLCDGLYIHHMAA